jgi:pimeloyl-ACP methyl ester carboxylesterase
MEKRTDRTGKGRFILAALCVCLLNTVNPAAQSNQGSGTGADGWKYGNFRTDDGCTIHYEEHGTGRKIILFVHGYQDSIGSFKAVEPYLQGDYRVIVYDLRAHGLSETTRDGYTMARYAADLKNLIDYLNLNQVNIIGYSMGGHILWEYIRQYGDAAFERVIVTNMSPKIYNDDKYKFGITGVTITEAFEQIKNYNAGYTAIMKKQQTDFAAFLATNKAYRDFYEHAVTYDPGAMTRLAIAMYAADYRDVLPKIKKPYFLIVGERDMYPQAGYQDQVKKVKGAKLAVMAGAGHMLIVDNPAGYAAEISKVVK